MSNEPEADGAAVGDPNTYYAGGLGVETYDLLHDPITRDIAFYLKCASRFGDPVLELGTGTGRVLLPLIEAGHEVTGLDLSPAMLQLARAKVRERVATGDRIRLVEGDMTAFDLGRRFALALVPARAFQHLITPEGQRAALTCIHRHLVPGGHLVLDLFDPIFENLFGAQKQAAFNREVRDESSGHLVRRTVVARHVDALNQVLTEQLCFERFNAAGDLIASGGTSWSLRWTLRQEMAYLLELCGFAVIEQYSDFNGSPPVYGREQLWIASAR
jgi:SAM-dependent methyltransferase